MRCASAAARSSWRTNPSATKSSRCRRLRAQVDEYRLYSGRCTGYGKLHAGVLPGGVPKGQLGPRALSLVGVLGTRYHLTQRKIRNCSIS